MRIAYFINQYPMVSHSFIRREILELEAQGDQVVRYSIRRNQTDLVDPEDLSEANKTHYLLERGYLIIIMDILSCMITSPASFLKAFAQAMGLASRSQVGRYRHLMYLFEACVLNRLMKASDVAHIHAHFGTNSAAVVMLAHFLGGVTYSFTVHGPNEFDQPVSLSLGEKIKYAEFVVAISSYGRSQLYRWCDYGFWKNIYIIHCALGDDFLASEAARPIDETRIICVGRLCEAKGQLLLLEAVAHVVAEGMKIELVLAGDGVMRSTVESMISNKGLSSHVKMLGWISSSRVRQEILASKAVVMPSFAEGLPVAIMEAGALRRPVISTAISGIPELVKDGQSGWLITAGSVDALVCALHELDSASQEELAEMGEDAYQEVLKKHNIHTEVKRIRACFQNIINQD